jgi:hypothetical protein
MNPDSNDNPEVCRTAMRVSIPLLPAAPVTINAINPCVFVPLDDPSLAKIVEDRDADWGENGCREKEGAHR